jgi:hypothetical protein
MIIRINIHVFIKSGDVIKPVQLLAFIVLIHCEDVTNVIFFFLCGFGDKKLIHNVTKHEMAKKLKNGYVQDTRKVTLTLMKKKRELLYVADVKDKKTEGRT